MKTHAPHVTPARPAEESQGILRDWWRSWDNFWFKPSDPTTIGLIRLCTGLIVVYVHFMYTFDLLSYVGPNAWVDQDGALKYLRYDVQFYTQPLDWTGPPVYVGKGHYIWSIFFHVHDPAWVYTVHFGILAIMCLFAVGLWTRVTSVLTWIGGMCYLQRAPTLLFGMDTMQNILLLYLMIAPGGAALSLDSWLRRRRERAAGLGDRPSPPLATATLASRLLQIHFCVIYLAAGLSKMLGAAWWNGTAVWGTMANSYFAPLNQAWYAGALEFLSKHRLLWELAMTGGCVFTLVLEIGLPFMIWNRKLRWLMVCGAVMLHVGIGLTMGLVGFGLCMLAMVLAFVPPEAVKALVDRIVGAWHESARVQPPVRVGAAPLAMSRR